MEMTKLKERENDAREVEQNVHQNKSGSSGRSNSPVYWMLLGAAIAIASVVASSLVPAGRVRDAVPTAQPAPNQNSSSALQ